MKLGFIIVARPSRPPGFDMTYRPTERVFPAPWKYRVPALVYLALASALLATVLVVEAGSTNSQLYVLLVEQTSRRIINARTFAVLLFVSALAAVLRSSMRGVRVHEDGIEYRDIIALLVPRMRRIRWPQIDRIILDHPKQIAVDLWDGTSAYLPAVANELGLVATLEKVALARAIPVRGGFGVDELPDAEELEQSAATQGLG
jgi:hypothetical protein